MQAEELGLSEKEQAEAKRRVEEKRVKEIMQDFEKRREARRNVESGWILNMNFLSGNQYCDVSPFGGVVGEDQRFYWQSRRVFNHIAPAVDSRIAKLEKLHTDLKVKAFSDEEGDLKASKLATGVLKYVHDRIGFWDTVSKATVWAETCGSAFYKVVWDEWGGRQVAVDENGAPVYEGEISVSAVSPFEVYPDSLQAESLGDLHSIIHAQTVTTGYVYEKFGIVVQADAPKTDSAVYSEAVAGKSPTPFGITATQEKEDGVLLIERYEKPTTAFPFGRLEIVAGGKLLYQGELPYQNAERSERGFPFVKQDCLRLPASFFGTSIIDRLIPVQRAYNAVRNRKHEFLNRLSMGVLTVEDGSVDTDELSEDGLLPGKVLVYRQGGKAPEMLDLGSMPSEFAQEEEWLEKEFALISGISDLTQSSTPTHVTSATGLQLLLAQDENRLSATLGSMNEAIREVGKHILRLYKQFAGSARLMTLTGENKKTQVYYFNALDLDVNDLQFEMQAVSTPEERKHTVLTLFEAGLLTEKDGTISAENRRRILETFGFTTYENTQDISTLHIAKAGEENLEMVKGDVQVDVYDEHDLHVVEHTRYLLSSEFKKVKNAQQIKARFIQHIAEHRKQKDGAQVCAEEEKGVEYGNGKQG